MEVNQLLEVLKFIRGAYSRFEINDDTTRVWYHFMQNESYESVMKKLRIHIKESRFEPTIHDLLERKSNLDNAMEIQRENEGRNEQPMDGFFC